MISFESDYITGAHPRVLEALVAANAEPLPAYGNDPYSLRAADKIREACQCPHAHVSFLTGGTQSNAVVIAALLRDWEGVVAADTGHISAHEAGAIEYTGHKVLTIPGVNGKILPESLQAYLHAFHTDENREHMVFPGMVYISHPTEYGTLYSADELSALSAICRSHGIPLYMDGARLGYGLMSRHTDVTLPHIAACCDAFTIGGTKMGALCGEGVVFPHGAPPHFLTTVKQHGALLAKSRLIGVQFDALFTDGLYFEIGRHAIRLAEEMKEIFLEKNIPLFMDSPTNQQFPILENGRMAELKKHLAFSYWERPDEHHTVVRFATTWSTTDEDVRALRNLL